jgi:hypothetical protein
VEADFRMTSVNPYTTEMVGLSFARQFPVSGQITNGTVNQLIIRNRIRAEKPYKTPI